MKRDWTPGPILVALCAACVAVGAVWLSYDRWPRGTAQAALWAVLTAACVWRANRNLRAELDAARRLLDAWNLSEARDELAQSPPAGTPSVELYDQDAPPDPLACVYDATDPAQVDRVAAGAADCGCLDCWGWLKRNGYLATPPPGVPRMGADLAYPMTVAETDRLVAQLQALPGEDVIESTDIPRGQGLTRLAEVAQRLAACQGGDPERIICVDTRCPGHGEVIASPHHQAALDPDPQPRSEEEAERWLGSRPTWTCDQILTEGLCGQPSERCLKEPHGYVRLCDRHYDEAMGLPTVRLHLGQPCARCGAPSTEPTLGELIEEVAADPDRQDELVSLTRRVREGGTRKADEWHLGQPCNVCDAPATNWVSDRPDPEIRDVTFLCDRDYADRMSEEDGRG